MKEQTDLAKFIRKKLIDCDLTTREFCEKLNITRAFLSSCFLGKKKFSWDKLQDIAEIIGLSESEKSELILLSTFNLPSLTIYKEETDEILYKMIIELLANQSSIPKQKLVDLREFVGKLIA